MHGAVLLLASRLALRRLRPPRSLAVPFADGRGSPDWFPADPPVGAGHLPACDVGADGGWRHVEEGRADTVITRAIDAHADSELRRDDGDGSSAGGLAPVG